ncbi:hypothetical protein [Variovorax sp. DAIF25]|uniref:hypothetical protein n=1 Tax=Variovorax sp. DAIF25 TaxID=3080983 RepID=UPI003D6C16C0
MPIEIADSPATTSLTLGALPPLGQSLEGGTFAGITTLADGKHVAVVLLPIKAEDINWKDAMELAASQGGELPSRAVAALLYVNLKPQLTPRWHWTCESYDASYAWYCNFDDGHQLTSRKSYEGCAVAVRLIPLTA